MQYREAKAEPAKPRKAGPKKKKYVGKLHIVAIDGTIYIGERVRLSACTFYRLPLPLAVCSCLRAVAGAFACIMSLRSLCGCAGQRSGHDAMPWPGRVRTTTE